MFDFQSSNQRIKLSFRSFRLLKGFKESKTCKNRIEFNHINFINLDKKNKRTMNISAIISAINKLWESKAYRFNNFLLTISRFLASQTDFSKIVQRYSASQLLTSQMSWFQLPKSLRMMKTYANHYSTKEKPSKIPLK